jgi:diguanylate cyclase (GGDEF)-like protein
MKKPDIIKTHPNSVRGVIDCFMSLLIIWSIYASINSYINNQQLLTFYTVELLVVLFVKLHPAFTTALILGSYTLNFLILNFGIKSGFINPYNYAMLALLSAAGAIINYRLTINYISEKNKANMLNKSLEIIANHDSTTRLQNRYALNQRIPDYLDRDICVAMGDINNFKMVNDTFGHTAGDDVLKAFSDILLDHFPKESIFRYGGDEFLIIEYGSNISAIQARLKSANEAFASAQITDVSITLSCSFGCVTAHPKNPQDLFDVLSQADQLLYKEKEKSKVGQDGPRKALESSQ